MRADIYLFEYGYTKSRSAARALIDGGGVRIDGVIVKKASEQIDESSEHDIELEAERFVCRGGLKLEHALEVFGIDVGGSVCIDIGASTGGFTDCLLSRGAKKVYAVDSGHGQLAPSLLARDDVVNIEGYNARDLKKEDFDLLFDIAVMDVSFISQTYMHGGIYSVTSDEGLLISLIKPQFEAGREAVKKGGIVKSASDRERAILRVIDSAAAVGFFCAGILRSPIDGGDGNMEYLALFTKKETGSMPDRKTIRSLAEGGGKQANV